jgi:hypothetical protein
MYIDFDKGLRDLMNDSNIPEKEVSIFKIDEPGEELKLLENIEDNSEKEIYNIIRPNYSNILKDLFVCESSKFKFLLTSTKFLSVLIQVMNEVKLNHDEIVYCNNFIYDYIVFQNNQDEYIRKLLFMLGQIINKPIVNCLYGTNILDEELSVFLAITCNSTFKEEINVKRVNFTLCTSSPKILSIQNIIDIYSQLYKSKFSILFTTTMFDIDIQKAELEDQPWINNIISTNNNNITMALIYILDSMQPSNVTKTLYKYAQIYKSFGYNDSNIRISLKNLPVMGLKKIPVVIDLIEGMEDDERYKLIIP